MIRLLIVEDDIGPIDLCRGWLPEDIARAAEIGREQLVQLTREMQARQILPAARLSTIRELVEAAPTVDRGRLEGVRENLRALGEAQLIQPQQ